MICLCDVVIKLYNLSFLFFFLVARTRDASHVTLYNHRHSARMKQTNNFSPPRQVSSTVQERRQTVALWSASAQMTHDLGLAPRVHSHGPKLSPRFLDRLKALESKYHVGAALRQNSGRYPRGPGLSPGHKDKS